MVLFGGMAPHRAAEGMSFNPFEPLLQPEQHLLQWLQSEAPDQVEFTATCVGVPNWLLQRFWDERGEKFGTQLAISLSQEAPLTIRVNHRKATVAQVKQLLQSEGIESSHCQWAPYGLQIHGRKSLTALKAFKQGIFEIQDEGSQLVAGLVDPPEKSLILDLCAGAGGKSLAIGAQLPSSSRILACDVRKDVLKEAICGRRHLQPKWF